MDRKSFTLGFAFALTTLAAAGLMLRWTSPLEAASPVEPQRWCEEESAGYGGAFPTRIVRNNTWATMTANIYATYHTQRLRAPLSEEKARELACRILYNVYHPEERTR